MAQSRYYWPKRHDGWQLSEPRCQYESEPGRPPCWQPKRRIGGLVLCPTHDRVVIDRMVFNGKA